MVGAEKVDQLGVVPIDQGIDLGDPDLAQVIDELKRMTIREDARHLGIGWNTVNEVPRADLSSRFSRPELKHLGLIAIDEITIGKGHRYLTVILDLPSGAVIFVGDGRGADCLAPFWKRLKRARVKIRAVAIDMSPVYIAAVSTNVPEAVIVFDHFHLIKLFRHMMSKLRRELQRRAENAGKKVLKGTRWLLLKNPGRLSPGHNEKQRLEEALLLNGSLATTCYLKEDLRQLWQIPDKPTARTFLDDWIARARASDSCHAAQICINSRQSSGRDPWPLRFPDFNKPSGMDQQQDQDIAKTGIWILGHGVFQTENLCPS